MKEMGYFGPVTPVRHLFGWRLGYKCGKQLREVVRNMAACGPMSNSFAVQWHIPEVPCALQDCKAGELRCTMVEDLIHEL